MPKSEIQQKVCDLEEAVEQLSYVLETLLCSVRIDGELLGDLAFPDRNKDEVLN